jgi:hypothetical protein
MAETLTRIEEAMTIAEHICKRKLKKINEMTSINGKNLSEAQKIFIREEKELITAVNQLIQEVRMKSDAELGVMPPFDADLENAVLGAILLEGPCFQAVKKFLVADHFYLSKNQIVYKACLDLDKAGEPVDMRTVVNQLRKNGTIEAVGGAHYIAELTAPISSAANVEYHARCLIEYAMRRELIRGSGKVIYEAHNESRDVFVLLEYVRTNFNRIYSWKDK